MGLVNGRPVMVQDPQGNHLGKGKRLPWFVEDLKSYWETPHAPHMHPTCTPHAPPSPCSLAVATEFPALEARLLNVGLLSRRHQTHQPHPGWGERRIPLFSGAMSHSWIFVCLWVLKEKPLGCGKTGQWIWENHLRIRILGARE